MSKLSFIHRFEPGTRSGALPLLLLHGTGGNEDDLIPVAKAVAPGAALLSPRGSVLEHGMPRFFRRFAEGVFDEADVRGRAHELADFVEQARNEYGIAAPIALGYSNGANIAAAVLMLRPEALAGGILLRAMMPLAGAKTTATLAGKGVLIVSGLRDPIASPEGAARLATLLQAAGAEVAHRSVPAGHELTQSDVTLARDWLARRAAARSNEGQAANAGSPVVI
jgi:phospholipase/carboxylesterase